MSWTLVVLGAVMVVMAWTEEIWTALWIDGHSAPLTRAHTRVTHRVLVRACRTRPRLLSLSGPLVLVSTVLIWTALLWAGFTLMLSAEPGALINSQTGVQANWKERVYFVGYSIFTFGNGDYSPQGTIWQWTAAVAGLSGLFLISLTVTYLLSVLGAAVNLRSFSSHVQALGQTAEEFVAQAWDGSSFRTLELQLLSLTEKLSLITERLSAYPMVHYYHARNRVQSLALGVAVFDDALLLLARGVAAPQRPPPATLRAARQTVATFLANSRSEHIGEAEHEPPTPSLAQLRAAGIPVVSDAEFSAVLKEDPERRRLLLGMLEMEARAWPGASE